MIMNPLWKKLAWKEQKEILLLHAPASFQQTINHLPDGTLLVTSIDQVNQFNYALVFVTQKIQIQEFAKACRDKIAGDAILWMCYPKGSSKKYTCDFNRDQGWEPMGEMGFEPVSQIAIDEDWSALRFRNVHFIKTLKRNPEHIMSKEGKARMQ